MTLLKVQNLKMYYKTLRGYVKAVDDISFSMQKGEALGLAGESGCGKTTAAFCILRLLPPNAELLEGDILFNGKSLLKMDKKKFRRDIRWRKISVIFQGAMNALHPVKKVGDQILEPILLHENTTKSDAIQRAEELLDLVGIGAHRFDRYPHELSGGIKQRTVIAMALACRPELVIADEPTTALDVIIQAQVLKVIRDLQQKMNLSMLLISHDLSMIAETCDKIAIMYAGKIVEYADSTAMFKKPTHPYAQKLIGAFPSVVGEKKELTSIGGFPPDLLNPPTACRFHPRCPYVERRCKEDEPKYVEIDGNGHYVLCHLAGS